MKTNLKKKSKKKWKKKQNNFPFSCYVLFLATEKFCQKRFELNNTAS